MRAGATEPWHLQRGTRSAVLSGILGIITASPVFEHSSCMSVCLSLWAGVSVCFTGAVRAVGLVAAVHPEDQGWLSVLTGLSICWVHWACLWVFRTETNIRVGSISYFSVHLPHLVWSTQSTLQIRLVSLFLFDCWWKQLLRQEFPFYTTSKTRNWIRVQLSCVPEQCSM